MNKRRLYIFVGVAFLATALSVACIGTVVDPQFGLINADPNQWTTYPSPDMPWYKVGMMPVLLTTIFISIAAYGIGFIAQLLFKDGDAE